MKKQISYRKQLLRAIEVFLKDTPESSDQAQRILQRCNKALSREEKDNTIDEMVWLYFFAVLGDSAFYQNKEFLQNTHEILLGRGSRNIVRSVFDVDFRSYFTIDETEWYHQLMQMIDLLMTVPFAKIYSSTAYARHNRKEWKTALDSLPEAALIEKLDEEYEQKTAIIADILARNPSPESIGDEKIYHFVLREITSLLTEIQIKANSMYHGYPVLGYRNCYFVSVDINEFPDMTEHILWAKRILESLTGKGAFFLSWRLSKAPTFDGDALIISLH